MMKVNNIILISFISSLFFYSCHGDYTPKPRGYYRINFPEKNYKHYKSDCQYSFDIPTYAEVRQDSSFDARKCWKNIVFPTLNGRIHISYYTLQSKKMFTELVEDSRRLVFKHTIKAEGIEESIISNSKEKVYGLFYDISGNTASSIQFFLTDSTNHFLRGALYFYAEPKADSIQPVLDFVKKDIDVMLKTFKWN